LMIMASSPSTDELIEIKRAHTRVER
jgi:hypothetical protein